MILNMSKALEIPAELRRLYRHRRPKGQGFLKVRGGKRPFTSSYFGFTVPEAYQKHHERCIELERQYSLPPNERDALVIAQCLWPTFTKDGPLDN